MKSFYDLQKYLEKKDKPEFPSFACLHPSDLTEEQLQKEYYVDVLKEVSANESMSPMLSDFVGIPVECDLNEIERLLSKSCGLKDEFFSEQSVKEIRKMEEKSETQSMEFRTASGLKEKPKDNTRENNKDISKENKENNKGCNVEQYIVDRIKNEILETDLEIKWEDIAGLEGVKKILTEIVVWPMLRPDIFTGLRGPPKGLLLFGPPGTGKTMIGKCIASQCKATFFSISSSSLTSKWVGEGEKMVRALFYLARTLQPSVVFIDEIDSLLSQRSENENEGSRRIKTEFLVQFDGVGTGKNDRILVIGATNRPQEIDEAARRRLVKRIYVPLPDESARKRMVSHLLKEYNNELTEDDYNEVSKITAGYSGSDIFNLCREASMEPLREIEDIAVLKTDQSRAIRLGDFVKALNQIRKSVSANDLEGYKKWNSLYGSGL